MDGPFENSAFSSFAAFGEVVGAITFRSLGGLFGRAVTSFLFKLPERLVHCDQAAFMLQTPLKVRKTRAFPICFPERDEFKG
jgi:hypothetical protein